MTKNATHAPPTDLPDLPGAWGWNGARQRWEPDAVPAPVALLSPGNPDHPTSSDHDDCTS